MMAAQWPDMMTSHIRPGKRINLFCQCGLDIIPFQILFKIRSYNTCKLLLELSYCCPVFFLTTSKKRVLG